MGTYLASYQTGGHMKIAGLVSCFSLLLFASAMADVRQQHSDLLARARNKNERSEQPQTQISAANQFHIWERASEEPNEAVDFAELNDTLFSQKLTCVFHYRSNTQPEYYYSEAYVAGVGRDPEVLNEKGEHPVVSVLHSAGAIAAEGKSRSRIYPKRYVEKAISDGEGLELEKHAGENLEFDCDQPGYKGTACRRTVRVLASGKIQIHEVSASFDSNGQPIATMESRCR
jgi:hypothetical protein